MISRLTGAMGLVLFALAFTTAHAQVPQLINYQGRVAVGSVNFDGSGSFKFALVNAAGTTTFWSNDGTSTAGSQPTAAVTLTVAKGLYSVLLGDTTLANMTAIPASVWANADVRLRVWFNDGTTGFQLLSPDQRLAPNGYLPDGAVSSSALAAGSVTTAKMAAGAVTSTQLAAGASAPPVTVSGITQTAAANTSYVATSTSPTTITLPVSANVGDQVQITGAGAGGWTAMFSDFTSTTWTARESARNWVPIASSADGSKLAAAEFSGSIYTSIDGGQTWTQRASAGSRNWVGIASSADGTLLVAAVYGGQLYTSTDSGITWTARDSVRNWTSVASSQDGTKLFAGTESGGPGRVYTSTDSGATWIQRGPAAQWSGVASSADGTTLVGATNGFIRTSSDSGLTWISRAPSGNFLSAASSADGTKLVAVATGGAIYTSTDSGVTWTARESSRSWQFVTSSADGTYLAAVVNIGQVYRSLDSGVTWTAQESNRAWQSVASSADGSKLAATVFGGNIHTWSATAAAASGAQGAEATLQYLGNGLWGAVGQTQIAAGAVGQTQIAAGAVGQTQITAGAVGTTSLANGAITAAKLDATSVGIWSVNGGDVFRSSGKVGIGTAIPNYNLHVVGNATLQIPASGSPIPALSIDVASFNNGANAAASYFVRARDTGSGSTPFIVTGDGRVGIGTETPATTLQVAGSVLAGTTDNTALVMDASPDARLGIVKKSGSNPYITSSSGSSIRFGRSDQTSLLTNIGGSTITESMRIDANGNVGIGTSTPGSRLEVSDGSIGLGIIPGQLNGVADADAVTLEVAGNKKLGIWDSLFVAGEITCVAVNLTSDRNAKEQFKPVNTRAVLDKVVAMPITEWQYKTETEARHIGPMAQDFRAAFALGHDEKHITSVDADGVALAAIQGLNAKVQEQDRDKDARIQGLEKSVAELKELVAKLARPKENQRDERE